MNKQVELEIQAIRKVDRALAGLTPEAKFKTLDFIWKALQEEVRVAQEALVRRGPTGVPETVTSDVGTTKSTQPTAG